MFVAVSSLERISDTLNGTNNGSLTMTAMHVLNPVNGHVGV